MQRIGIFFVVPKHPTKTSSRLDVLAQTLQANAFGKVSFNVTLELQFTHAVLAILTTLTAARRNNPTD
jgi:hypothetical protein